MAKIIIKRREDPIFIENERAERLRSKWLDENTPRSDLVSLGDWAGTYGDIKSVEIEHTTKDCPHEWTLYGNALGPDNKPSGKIWYCQKCKKTKFESLT